MKKVLCFQCKTWSTNPEICENCDYILNREQRKEIQAKEEGTYVNPNPPKIPSRLSKAMNYLKASRNPLLNILYYIIMSIWLTYVGIMLLIMYIVAIATS